MEPGKTQLVFFDQSNNPGAFDVKMDQPVLELGLLGWDCLWLLNCLKALTLSLMLKLPPRNMEPWSFLWSSFLLLYLYKFTTRPYIEYCCHVWVGGPSCYFGKLDKLQKPSAHRRIVPRGCLFCSFSLGRCSSEQVELVAIFNLFDRSLFLWVV